MKYIEEILIVLVCSVLIIGCASAIMLINYRVALKYSDEMDPVFILGVPFFICFFVVLLFLIRDYYT